MKNFTNQKGITIGLITIFILSGSLPAFGLQVNIDEANEIFNLNYGSNLKYIEYELRLLLTKKTETMRIDRSVADFKEETKEHTTGWNYK